MEICAELHYRYKYDLLLNLGDGIFILLRADCEISYSFLTELYLTSLSCNLNLDNLLIFNLKCNHSI